MAPRTRSRAAKEARALAAPSNITDLPDDLLVQCFANLETKERLRSAALVCKRFAALCCSPQLVRDIQAGYVGGLQKLRSLALWLQRYSPHLRELQFHSQYDNEQDSAYTASYDALDAAMRSCLAAASAAGRLEYLAIERSCFDLEWLPAMPSLRGLDLYYNDDPLRVSAAINALPALESLWLTSTETITFEGGVSLPTTLTRLWLEVEVGWEVDVADDEREDMPPQIAQLPKLADLQLDDCGYNSASLSVLSRLSGSLTRLDIGGCRLPSLLAALTQLRCLSLRACNLQTTTLLHMPHVTRLDLNAADSGLGLPALLRGLPNLQQLYLNFYPDASSDESSDESGDEAAAAVEAEAGCGAQLPPDARLPHLRWLSMPISSLQQSLSALRGAAAPALQVVEVRANPAHSLYEWLDQGPGSRPSAALFDWLAEHQPLRQVFLFDTPQSWAGYVSVFDLAASKDLATQLAHRRPGLLVQRISDSQQSMQALEGEAS
ncbi:p53-induced death domain-containing 1 isoform X1 [Chlorella sorokiniana]|uniref:P53-induced death domain-containing 1 isoform X1 n=1 Tax=Chlorella sorokiniana TaxID=3076 RepID=A0A2P6TEC5_CHLSO|nr:p53-induced death domain-containing 1 isoform X1 [Chlorella sorokiniana]|eukprot:PRW20972.1 p53-induced death domain-containing 1 isoform X1 [Chlorella sorokiniana]